MTAKANIESQEEQRRAFCDQMQAQLDAASAKIDAHADAARQADTPEKLKLYDQVEDLRIKEKGVRVELNSLRQSGAEQFNEQKSALQTAYEALDEALAEALADTKR